VKRRDLLAGLAAAAAASGCTSPAPGRAQASPAPGRAQASPAPGRAQPSPAPYASPVPLPPPQVTGTISLENAIGERRSRRAFRPDPLPAATGGGHPRPAPRSDRPVPDPGRPPPLTDRPTLAMIVTAQATRSDRHSHSPSSMQQAIPESRIWPVTWVGVAGFEPAASSSRTSGAAGRLVVVPASSVCHWSCPRADVRGHCCSSVLYGAPHWQLGSSPAGSVQAGPTSVIGPASGVTEPHERAHLVAICDRIEEAVRRKGEQEPIPIRRDRPETR
jgi:hypothetical protein